MPLFGTSGPVRLRVSCSCTAYHLDLHSHASQGLSMQFGELRSRSQPLWTQECQFRHQISRSRYVLWVTRVTASRKGKCRHKKAMQWPETWNVIFLSSVLQRTALMSRKRSTTLYAFFGNGEKMQVCQVIQEINAIHKAPPITTHRDTTLSSALYGAKRYPFHATREGAMLVGRDSLPPL